MNEAIVIREWDADIFHRRVAELEAVGYIARLQSYSITAEMDPETGNIIHLHSVEMDPPSSNDRLG